MLAEKWAVENGLLPDTAKWVRRKMIEKDGKKLFRDWEHPMRMDCIVRRPDLTLEETSKKTILLIDMAYPNEYNKMAKQDEKIGSTIDYALN